MNLKRILKGALIRMVVYPLVILVGVFVVVGAMAWWDESSNTRRSPDPSQDAATIDLGEYLALTDGISYERATQIVGNGGIEASRSAIGGTVTVMIQWDGIGGFGANANAMFQDGKLISKAQYGLRY
jgi:hypothetical protein